MRVNEAGFVLGLTYDDKKYGSVLARDGLFNNDDTYRYINLQFLLLLNQPTKVVATCMIIKQLVEI